ncbi:hypothetical protein [Brevundimonas sp. LjRoot202]|uniref:hypothetical protein n=1 Tax=Brevundimonas sp. LjRoot202 TaxID=3342281 RepID=UPI003ED04DC6
MKQYVLSIITFGVPMPQPFAAPSDHDALWFARGFIEGSIGRDRAAYLGSEWRLDATPENGVFDDASEFGRCVIEEVDGVIGQSWKTRRRSPSGPDMNVDDPHDAPRPPRPGGPTPSGKIRKKAAGAR